MKNAYWKFILQAHNNFFVFNNLTFEKKELNPKQNQNVSCLWAQTSLTEGKRTMSTLKIVPFSTLGTWNYSEIYTVASLRAKFKADEPLMR